MRDAMKKVSQGHALDEAEAADAMRTIMRGEAQPTQIAGLAMALAARGETIDEIAGLARAAREFAVGVDAGVDAMDICGTGGDGLGTFNISTTAAIVTAACGVTMAKHGNRAVSSSCGSADVLEELGVRIELPPEDVARCMATVGIGFLFAPICHPAFGHAAAVRRELGARTVFNLLGPLVNPARPRLQTMGVPSAELVRPMAEVLSRLGSVRALVFHSLDGMDELTTSAPAEVVEVRDGACTAYRFDPATLGLPRASLEDLRGGDRARNAEITTRVLAGEPGAARDVVLLNTAAALRTSGRVSHWQEGLAAAARAVDSGAAAGLLQRWRELTWELSGERWSTEVAA